MSPLTYDYDRVSRVSPWKQMPGRYTREGDVRELLGTIDDRFVVSRSGDQIALSFPADGPVPIGVPVGAGHAPPASGHARPPRRPRPPPRQAITLFLFAHGYSKEMDINSASPDEVGPLPFRGMNRYPYAAPEAYPSTAAHREYIARYNTRVVGRASARHRRPRRPRQVGRKRADSRGSGAATADPKFWSQIQNVSA